MGRPKKEIDEQEVRRLFGFGETRDAIASTLHIDVKTLRTFCKERNIRQKLAYAETEEYVRAFANEQPGIGMRCVHEFLNSDGKRVSRADCGQVLQEMDPDAVPARKHQRLKRRVYRSICSHHTWHMDGNLKLGPVAGIVIHGAIDGHSRTIVYMEASDNNRANTVLRLFNGAMLKHDTTPVQMVADRGNENLFVKRRIDLLRGGPDTRPRPFAATTSQRNQPIERSWVDTKQKVIFRYKTLFETWEHTIGYVRDNKIHRWVVQYLFIPLINMRLQQHVQYWNYHRIRTKSNMRPIVVVENDAQAGVVPLCIYEPADFGEEDEHMLVDEEDDEGDAQPGDEELSTVNIVNSIPCPLQTEEKQRAFFGHIRPILLTDVDGDHTNAHYTQRFVQAVGLMNHLYNL